jgi:hypothetical protein
MSIFIYLFLQNSENLENSYKRKKIIIMLKKLQIIPTLLPDLRPTMLEIYISEVTNL